MPTNLGRLRGWLTPIGIVLGLLLLIVLSNRSILTQDGLPIITDPQAYNSLLKDAMDLTRKNFTLYDSGKELNEAQKGELLRAAKMFDAMDKYQPTKTGPFMGAGKSYQILGENEMADERLRQCISNGQYDSSPEGKATVIEAKYLLSLVRGSENDWPTAFQLADEAVKAIPTSSNYLTARASAELQTDKPAEAKLDLAQALVLDPKNRRATELARLISTSAKAKP